MIGVHIGDLCRMQGGTNNYERAIFIRNNVLVDIGLDQNKRAYIDNIAHVIDDDLIRWSNLRSE